MAGLKYLKNKSWSDITREERFFCSHLYTSIVGREKEFVKWLNTKTKINLNENSNWEIGFEVCFYRDYLKYLGKSVKSYRYSSKRHFPQKRTFDLCLFSNDHIVIIEAKVQQEFNEKQLGNLLSDTKMTSELLRRNHHLVKVDGILLHSYDYEDNRFYVITWQDIIADFDDSTVLKLAADKFKK